MAFDLTNKRALLVHVPYANPGGEEVHVMQLQAAYAELGVATKMFPGVAVHASLKKSFRSLLPSAGLPELDQLRREFAFDFIHLNNAFPVLGPRFFRWGLRKKVPVLMTIHNHRFFCTNGLALRQERQCKDCFHSKVLWRSLLHNCNNDIVKTAYHSIALTEMHLGKLYENAVHTYIAPSPYIRDELIRFGIAKERVRHILHPLSTSSNVKRADPPIYDLLFAGRLSYEKGIRTLLDAAKILPEFRIAIVGQGPEEGRVKAAAEKNKNITYLGYRPRQEVLNLIGATRVGLLPSSCNEILSLFALEVFSQGKYCVVSRSDSMSWVNDLEMPGIFANPNDAVDFARAVKEALAAPAISAERRQIIQKKLSKERFAAELGEVVGELFRKSDKVGLEGREDV